MDSYNFMVVSAVERTIKKYADNILRVLEGMNGRLSQLESVTQVLEHSVASLKASVDEYHGEADTRMRTLNNHVMEMHRAVQILRDKQDIIETHAELAKLQASKAEATAEKPSAGVSAAKQTVVSPQTLPQAVNPNIVQAMSSTQLQVPLLQPNQTDGQLQLLSLPPAVNTLPQQYVPVHTQIQQQQAQQPHLQSQSELHQPLQPQELTQQSMSRPLQTQPQHVQTQHSVQYQAQGLQALSLQGSGQQLPQPQLQTLKQQTLPVMPQSEQAQFQVMPQHLQMHQLLSQQAGGQPSVQVSRAQYVSAPHTLPAQTMVQLQQVQPAASPQLQVPQHFPPSVPTAALALVQPPPVPQNPSAQLQLQGVPPVQGSFQFTQQNESLTHAPLPQGAPVQAPFTQVGYGVGPYGLANTSSSQQHLSSTQSVQSAQHSNSPYQRNPMHLPGSQPVYASQTSGPITSPIANARALPVAQTVYNQSLPGGPSNHLPHDGIIEKAAAMGFSRDEVRSVIRRLTDRGGFVDMNVVLDTLTNGGNQSQRGWQVR